MKHFIQLLCLGLVPLSLYGQLLITEIADPVNNTEGRFIEIYNRSALPVDLTNHKLVRWTNNSPTYTASTAIDLSSVGTLNPGQFLIVAANSSSFNTLFGFSPDMAQGNGPADSNGNDQMAILFGETIIDIFGVPVEDGLNTCHDFTDGRAERKAFVLQSKPSFDESQWNVWSNSNPTSCTSHVTGTQTAPSDFDPGHWIGESPNIDDMTINSAVYFENLTLNTNKTLTILKNGQLTINGSFNNQGAVVMHSDSDEYSVFTVGSVSGNGTYAYNRWAASTATNDLITAPFAGQAFNDFLNNNSGIINTNPNDTSQNLFGNFNNDTGTYENFSSSNTTILTSGVGYRVGTNSGATLAFQGQFNTTDQSVPITVGSSAAYGRWNLVGNPFPSFIKLDGFFSANSSVLDPNYAAVYTYNGSGWTIYNNANSTGKLIAPGQGFFLASGIGGGNVSFTKVMQSASVSDDFISGEHQEPDSYLKMNINSGNDHFSSEIYLNSNASLGMDVGYDAGLFAEQTPQLCLYSHLAQNDVGLKLAIQSIPKELTDTVVIPLGVNTLANTSVSLGLDSDVVLNSLHVYLEDTVENTWTELSDHHYNFNSSTDLQGTGRFFLYLSNQALNTPLFDTNNFRIVSATGYVIIQGALNIGDEINIHDLQGRELIEQNVTEPNNQTTVETSRLEPGMYLVRINSKRGAKTYKIIVK
jgi:hypothetical protein